MSRSDHAARIAAFNDRLRRFRKCGDWLFTASVRARGASFVAEAAAAVSAFDGFSNRERDFGAVDVADVPLIFKIDYYDLDLRCRSENPADETITRRVLTVMLADEY